MKCEVGYDARGAGLRNRRDCNLQRAFFRQLSPWTSIVSTDNC
jgi:hypothetical protein